MLTLETPRKIGDLHSERTDGAETAFVIWRYRVGLSAQPCQAGRAQRRASRAVIVSIGQTVSLRSGVGVGGNHPRN